MIFEYYTQVLVGKKAVLLKKKLRGEDRLHRYVARNFSIWL